MIRGAGMSHRSIKILLSRAVSERGATAAEYAILAAFIGAVVVVSITALGGVVVGLFETVVGTF